MHRRRLHALTLVPLVLAFAPGCLINRDLYETKRAELAGTGTTGTTTGTTTGDDTGDGPGWSTAERATPDPLPPPTASTVPPCEAPPEDRLAAWFACTTDADCVQVTPGCCGCSEGGLLVAVADTWAHCLGTCDVADVGGMCPQVYLCDDRVPACVEGTCQRVDP